MAASEWGDELMLQMLAQVWQRSICVISPIAVQTFYPGGFMVNGADPNAVWVGHVVDWHYYGVLRGEDLVVPANRGRGMPLLVRQRQDGACGGRGKRRFLRPPKSGKRRQTGGTEGRYDDEKEGRDGALSDEPQDGADEQIPSYDDIPYTAERQRSPDRDKRGRRAMRGKVSKTQRGKSLWALVHGSELELCEHSRFPIVGRLCTRTSATLGH